MRPFNISFKMKKTEKQKEIDQKEITRKEALSKIGLTALSAATMMILINDPAKADDNGSPDILPDF